jgi:hypothetical protein
MNRRKRIVRWLMVAGLPGFMPAFVMRCDKAALNFQRGLFEGLGMSVGDMVINQIPVDGDAAG